MVASRVKAKRTVRYFDSVSGEAQRRWRTYSRGRLVPVELIAFDPGHDYVGPEGWRAKFVPNTIYLIDVNYAAFWHDRLYWLGGLEGDRYFADNEFLSIMLYIIEDRFAKLILIGKLLVFLASHRAMSYYMAVRGGGSECFSYNEVRTGAIV